jgi:N-acetylglucosaminyldiphosphoundecaprenol N-acetyl-beta-D-mannosaminyltransferase
MTIPQKQSSAITKRALDLIITIPTLIFVAPALLFAWCSHVLGKPTLAPVVLLGARRRAYRSVTSNLGAIRHAFRLWDVLRGRASLVGPRLLPLAQLDAEAVELRAIVSPGLVCLHWLRWRSNIAFRAESLSDAEYAAKASTKLDISILARAVLALIYGRSGQQAERDINVLGVHIDNLTMPEALRSIEAALDEQVNATQIAFVNADCLNRATTDAVYREALEKTSLVLADGIGLKIAGTLLSRPVRQNVNGTDLFPKLCESLNRRSAGLFLLGARPEVVSALARRIETNYPRIRICGTHDGYFGDETVVVSQIADAAADVVLVALGAPHQEVFIARNKHLMGAKVCIGVGGLFDFYSGRIPRAPQWVREAGLEWVYRLYQEPGRMWRRYLIGNIVFLFRVLAERFGFHQGNPNTAVIR